MARLSREDFLAKLGELIGEDTSENALQLLEDMTDTYDELENTQTGGENWEERYRKNDEEWRKKYRDRFFSGGSKEEEEIEEEIDDDTDEPEITINDLFSESE